MARAARAHLKLERILFMPTGTTRYRASAVASPGQRVAMLRLALADEEGWDIDARELAPGASGYTYDTLKELRLELGAGTQLWLLLGADQYAKLDTWHRPEDIRKLARIGVFARPGVALPGDLRVIPMTPMAVSASDIRARAGRGEDVSAMVPPAVADYIARERLYR
jgi:nicotinate-nucleotide adenylyltransferase